MRNGTFCCVIIALTFLSGISNAAEKETPTASWMTFKPWQEMGLAFSYYSLEYRPQATEKQRFGLWFSANVNGTDSIIELQGPDFSNLNRVPPQFDATIIRKYTEELNGRKTPIISRSSATRLADGSVVVLASIGPAYNSGKSELYPALFFKAKDSKKWQHLGAPSGEPQQWLDKERAAKRKIRSDGGSIIQLPDGRLRMYNQCFGARLSIAEAATVHGPWTILKDDQGKAIDARASLPGGAWLFPQVVPIAEHGYILTGGNTWPPTQIWAAVSTDGISFSVPQENGQARPMLLPTDVLAGAKSMKSLRLVYDPLGKRLFAVSNPWQAQHRDYPLLWSEAQLDLSVFSAK